jgi:hypothetical protein
MQARDKDSDRGQGASFVHRNEAAKQDITQRTEAHKAQQARSRLSLRTC